MQHTLRFLFPLIVPALAALCVPACTGQIRNAEQIQNDPYLKYITPEFAAHRPERVIDLVPPSSPENLNDLGVAHARRLELDLAEERFKAALAARPAGTLPYLNLARLYTICEEPERASAVFAQMAANRQLDGERLFLLARGLFDQGRREESLGLMEALVVQERHGALPADWLGFYALDLENFQKANFYFERSLEIQPAGARGLYGLGLTASLADDHKRAAIYLAEARKRGAREPELDLRLAMALLKQDQLAQALTVLESAARPRSLELVELHGRVLLRQNYRANLRPLLEDVAVPADRRRLLQTWYGTDRPEELQSLYDEFDLYY